MEETDFSSPRTLEAALRDFSDPDGIRYMDEFKQFARRPPVMFTGGDPDFDGHLEWRKRRSPLEQEFLAMLRRGELVATGLAHPVTLSTKREIIPSHLWDVLTPDFETSEAKGAGLHIVRVEVSRGAATPDGVSTGLPEFTHNADYSRVTIRHHVFDLSGGLTNVVRLLHEASMTADPWRNGKKLLESAGYDSMFLGDVFKRHPDWRELIEGNGRGLYRLNLKGPSGKS
jgi:hypothetical protein